jgi:uncharacterized protein YbdZ (MbtH family)
MVEISDPATHRRAYTMQIPAGWKFTGMIAYPGGCHPPSVPANGLSYTVLAPDGVTAFERLPGVSWAWASDGTNPNGRKCAPIKISTAVQFLLNIAIPNLRPDAKNITVVALTPQMRQTLAAGNRQLQAQAQPQFHSTEDAARVRLQYTLKGRPVEELLFTIISCNIADMPAFPMLRRPAMTRNICQSTGTIIKRAPRGRLDELLAQKDPMPVIDPQWDAYIQQNMRSQFSAWRKSNDAVFREIQNHFKGVTDQMVQGSVAFRSAQKSSFDNAMAQDRATQGSIDHAAQMQVRDSLNRQDFIDPNTGRKIETSNQYSHNWMGSDGQSVVLGNDPTYDPNGQVDPVRQSWTELVPVN